jgi:hypothetical protein
MNRRRRIRMVETQSKPRLQSQLEWSDNKSIHSEARFDMLAQHDNRLTIIRLVAFSQDVKTILAALAVGLTCPIRLKNVTLNKNDDSMVPKDVWPSLSGYRIDSHRLGFGSIHAMFVCPQQGFLANDSDDALWQELKQERFSTPMLRGWLPYIRKELERKSLLSRCYVLDCARCVLAAASADSDAIVEFGIKNGLIAIQAEAA